MRILIVSGYFYPHITPRSHRTTELVKAFSRQGHEVVLLIPEFEADYTQFLIKHKGVTLKNILTHYERQFLSSDSRWSILLKRIVGLLFEYPEIKYYFTLPKVLRKESGYDLLLSIAAPHSIHWGVMRSMKKKKKPAKKWIADCGDPFMFTPLLNKPHPFYFKYFEKSFCKKADYITVPLESAKAGYYPEFHDKIRIIPQAYDFDEVKIKTPYTPNKIITFAYAGTFIKGTSEPGPILDFLINASVDFRFIIYTKQQGLFDKYISLLGEKIVLKPYVDRYELLFELSKMDFLLAFEFTTTIIIPSKLIDYSLTRRPILSIHPQKMDKEKFLQFLKGDYSQQTVINNIENYNITNATKQFIALAAN